MGAVVAQELPDHSPHLGKAAGNVDGFPHWSMPATPARSGAYRRSPHLRRMVPSRRTLLALPLALAAPAHAAPEAALLARRLQDGGVVLVGSILNDD